MSEFLALLNSSAGGQLTDAQLKKLAEGATETLAGVREAVDAVVKKRDSTFRPDVPVVVSAGYTTDTTTPPWMIFPDGRIVPGAFIRDDYQITTNGTGPLPAAATPVIQDSSKSQPKVLNTPKLTKLANEAAKETPMSTKETGAQNLGADEALFRFEQKRAEAEAKKNKEVAVAQALQAEASDAAWRLAANQLVKLAREPVVAALSRNLAPGDDALRGRIAAFLETELGVAALTAIIAAGLTAMPHVPVPGANSQTVSRLAQELRVKSMATAADVVADLLMGPLREAISTAILTAGIPPQLDGAKFTTSTEQRQADSVPVDFTR